MPTTSPTILSTRHFTCCDDLEQSLTVIADFLNPLWLKEEIERIKRHPLFHRSSSHDLLKASDTGPLVRLWYTGSEVATLNAIAPTARNDSVSSPLIWLKRLAQAIITLKNDVNLQHWCQPLRDTRFWDATFTLCLAAAYLNGNLLEIKQTFVQEPPLLLPPPPYFPAPVFRLGSTTVATATLLPAINHTPARTTATELIKKAAPRLKSTGAALFHLLIYPVEDLTFPSVLPPHITLFLWTADEEEFFL